MATAELESELVNLAGRIASAQCRFLRLLAEFDARQGWAGPGIRSCAHWLSWQVGLSRRTGREQLRVAKALRGLPMINAAFAAGRLSYAKVRAITRVAAPGNEQALLDLALAGTASHVERAVRAIRLASNPAAQRTARRAVSWRWDQDGCLVLRATLPPEEGARLIGALQKRMGQDHPASRTDPSPAQHPSIQPTGQQPSSQPTDSAPPRPASTPRPAGVADQAAGQRPGVADQAQVGPLGGSAEPDPARTDPPTPQRPEPTGQAAGQRSGSTDQPQPSRGGGSAEPLPQPHNAAESTLTLQVGLEHPPGAARDRLAARRADALLELLAPDTGQHQLTVHLEVATGQATLDHNEPLPLAPSTAQRLACDARIRALIKDQHGNPLYLGRAHRLVTKTQLAALHIRDQHRCQFPGCDHQRHLHAHHIVHWCHGGKTNIDNLVLLCGFHHRLIHDHPHHLQRHHGRLRIWRANGTEITAQQQPAPVVDHVLSPYDLTVEHHIDNQAIVPAWTGERLDLNAVLAATLPATPTAA